MVLNISLNLITVNNNNNNLKSVGSTKQHFVKLKDYVNFLNIERFVIKKHF